MGKESVGIFCRISNMLELRTMNKRTQTYLLCWDAERLLPFLGYSLVRLCGKMQLVKGDLYVSLTLR